MLQCKISCSMLRSLNTALAAVVTRHPMHEYRRIQPPQRFPMAARGRTTKVQQEQTMNVNEQFTRQAQDMFNAAKDARIPENVQHMAEEGVAKTREAYQKINAVTKDGAKVMEDVMLTAHAGAKTLGEKVLHNTMANTEAAFDAAQAIARARSLPEAAKLQADFMQQQFAIAGAQFKEFFELSTKVSKQTFETMNAAATKNFEQMKKSA
jgi:hypothetical protein